MPILAIDRPSRWHAFSPSPCASRHPAFCPCRRSDEVDLHSHQNTPRHHAPPPAAMVQGQAHLQTLRVLRNLDLADRGRTSGPAPREMSLVSPRDAAFATNGYRESPAARLATATGTVPWIVADASDLACRIFDDRGAGRDFDGFRSRHSASSPVGKIPIAF
jgi:hypothetical protein